MLICGYSMILLTDTNNYASNSISYAKKNYHDYLVDYTGLFSADNKMNQVHSN